MFNPRDGIHSLNSPASVNVKVSMSNTNTQVTPSIVIFVFGVALDSFQKSDNQGSSGVQKN
jgi:hypothetical protein